MTFNYLQRKIQEKVNALLKEQSDLRASHNKMEDRIYSSSQGQYLDEKLHAAKLSLYVEHIDQIETLEKKCGSIMRKFVERKIQKNNNQINLNR